PFREIALEPTAREEPYRAYDTSGPYTDPAVTIDLEAGLPPLRAEWIARRGFERIAPRAVKDVDNGGASGDRLRPPRPAPAPARRGARRLPGGGPGGGRTAGPAGHAVRVRPRRHRHRGDGLRRAPREPGSPGGTRRCRRAPSRRRRLRRRDP